MFEALKGDNWERVLNAIVYANETFARKIQSALWKKKRGSSTEAYHRIKFASALSAPDTILLHIFMGTIWQTYIVMHNKM